MALSRRFQTDDDLAAQLDAAHDRIPEPLRGYIADTWDGGDVWGSLMMWGFALCDQATVWGMGDAIPDAVNYRPGALTYATDSTPEQPDEWPDAEVWELINAGDITPADITAALEALNDALDAVKAAGKDY